MWAVLMTLAETVFTSVVHWTMGLIDSFSNVHVV